MRYIAVDVGIDSVRMLRNNYKTEQCEYILAVRRGYCTPEYMRRHDKEVAHIFICHWGA